MGTDRTGDNAGIIQSSPGHVYTGQKTVLTSGMS